jgi:hypothetical protein
MDNAMKTALRRFVESLRKRQMPFRLDDDEFLGPRIRDDPEVRAIIYSEIFKFHLGT